MRKMLLIISVVVITSCSTTSQYAGLYPHDEPAEQEVTVRQWRVVWLHFTPDPKQRWERLHDKAVDRIAEEYGSGELTNVEIRSRWSPLSILLYFNVFGWVEQSTLTAGVVSDSSLDDRTLDAVISGDVFEGMDSRYIVYAIGRPNYTESRDGRERWVYGYRSDLYVGDGVIVEDNYRHDYGRTTIHPDGKTGILWF